MQSILRGLDVDVNIRVHTDASAAIGICRRKGIGKIRHIHVSDLWVQDKLKEEAFELEKVLGTENPADALTKYIDASDMQKHLETMGVE